MCNVDEAIAEEDGEDKENDGEIDEAAVEEAKRALMGRTKRPDKNADEK